MPQRIRTSLGLGQGWTQCPTLDVVLYQILQVSEQWCHESACNPVVLPIGVGAGNYLEMRGVFRWISPNLPEKILGHFLCEYFLMKTGLSDDLQKQGLYVILGAIFSNQSTLGAIFNPISWDFAQIFRDFAKVFTDFTQISTDFSGILPEFSPNQNFWGCASTLCTPTSYTTGSTSNAVIKRSVSVFINLRCANNLCLYSVDFVFDSNIRHYDTTNKLKYMFFSSGTIRYKLIFFLQHNAHVVFSVTQGVNTIRVC